MDRSMDHRHNYLQTFINISLKVLMFVLFLLLFFYRHHIIVVMLCSRCHRHFIITLFLSIHKKCVTVYIWTSCCNLSSLIYDGDDYSNDGNAWRRRNYRSYIYICFFVFLNGTMQHRVEICEFPLLSLLSSTSGSTVQ